MPDEKQKQRDVAAKQPPFTMADLGLLNPEPLANAIWQQRGLLNPMPLAKGVLTGARDIGLHGGNALMDMAGVPPLPPQGKYEKPAQGDPTLLGKMIDPGPPGQPTWLDKFFNFLHGAPL